MDIQQTFAVNIPADLQRYSCHIVERIKARIEKTEPPSPRTVMEDQCQWCEASIPGDWSVERGRTNEFVFRFERQEDAALFKLFHGGA